MNRKKYGKLAVSAMKRKKSIEKLGIVDKVLIGHKIDKLRIIKKEKPDTIALGYDQNMPELDKISIKKKRIQRFHKS
jgi:glycerol-3-phosphate cytidylyltransferase-like family protein